MDIETLIHILENGTDDELNALADLAYEGFKDIVPLLPEVDDHA